MNTLFHVLDDEFVLVASVLFKLIPEELIGYKPAVGKIVPLGPPFSKSAIEEKEYEIVGIAEEKEDDGIVCALRLIPKRTLQ